MSIGAVGSSQASLMTSASLSGLKGALDVQKSEGAQVVQMIQQSTSPNLGKNLDVRV